MGAVRKLDIVKIWRGVRKLDMVKIRALKVKKNRLSKAFQFNKNSLKPFKDFAPSEDLQGLEVLKVEWGN